MSITAERKQTLIKDYAVKSGDTGSPEVQVAILTERITNLTGHFKTHVGRGRTGPGIGPVASRVRGRGARAAAWGLRAISRQGPRHGRIAGRFARRKVRSAPPFCPWRVASRIMRIHNV